MVWDYRLSTNTIWTSFDHGQVEADTYEEACELALKELKYNVDKANTVFKHCDITPGFKIEMDYTQLEVILVEVPPKGKLISIYYWRASKDDLDILGYDVKQTFPYNETKVCEIILDVINKGYNVQTRDNKEMFTICIDKGNFKQM